MITTIAVTENDDRHDDRGQRRDPIPMHAGERSPIKHVFYIIKENRTYDQALATCHKATAI